MTEKGGAPAETDAIRAKSGVGSGSLENPTISIDRNEYISYDNARSKSKKGKCYAFYVKVAKDPNLCTVMGWCGKERKTVYRTLAHMDYMNEYIPEWLDDEITFNRVSFLESSTRQLIPLKKQDEELHDIVLEGLQKLPSIKERTYKATRDLILAHRRDRMKQKSSNGDLKIIYGDYRASVPDKFDLLITDPPYMTDVVNIDEFVREWVPIVLEHIKDSGQAYIFTGSYFEEQRAYFNELSRHERFTKQILIWEYRNTIGPAPKTAYKNNHQVIFYLRGPDAPDIQTDELNIIELFTVQRFNAPDGRFGEGRYHPWEKPLDLAKQLIIHGSREGDLVFDPFAGTGTFLLASSQLGRKAIGTEIDKNMVKIAEERGCTIAE